MAAASADTLDRAIAWAVRLESGSATDAERAACAAWRAAAPQHEQAWQQVQAVEQAFRDVPADQGPLALNVLQAAKGLQSQGRRRAARLLGLGAMGALTAVLAARLAPPWKEQQAYATAIGERRSALLPDGTGLQLDTGTEAQAIFTPLRRLVVLRRGEIFIHTGPDADALAGRRPFWVETAEARLEALGTRFGVRQGEGETRVYVTEGRVAVHARSGSAQPVIAGPGDSFVIRSSATGAAPGRTPSQGLAPGTWTEGVLVAKQMRLDAFVAELARYSPAPLACDPAVAALRVSGVFQLNGPDPAGQALQALQALTRTLPVRVVQRGNGTIAVAALH